MNVISAFYYRPLTKLREGNVFSCARLFIGWGDMAINHDTLDLRPSNLFNLDFTVQGPPPPFPAPAPLPDMFKLVHMHVRLGSGQSASYWNASLFYLK